MTPTDIALWAHRGSHGAGGPLENSVAAFERAIAEGAAGIELDVHLSADGVPIVFHDETLARLTADADPRRVDALSAAALAEIELVGGARIPTLSDVLDLTAGRIALNIELKDPAGVEATAALLGGQTDGIMLSSFAESAVAAAACRLPKVARALIVEPDPSAGPAEPHLRAAIGRTDATHLHPEHVMVDATLVAALPVPLNVWTVNDPGVARRMAECGVAGVMTDRPGWLGRALARGIDRLY